MTTVTATHTIRLTSSTFQQALTSALLFLPKPGSFSRTARESIGHVCLHIEEGGTHLSVNALDGCGFYRQLLPLYRETDKEGREIGPVSSLPTGETAWANIGQLLIHADAAATLLKLIPRKAYHQPVTLEVRPSGVQPSGKQEVRFTSSDGSLFSFTAPVLPFPDYTAFVARAMQNKEALNVPQLRAFPAAAFIRLGKALPVSKGKEFFYTYWGKDQESPCLVEFGPDIMIVYMPGKIPPGKA